VEVFALDVDGLRLEDDVLGLAERDVGRNKVGGI
jgi:hypothetical protein